MNEKEFFKRLGIEGNLPKSLLSRFPDLDELTHGGFSNEIVSVCSRPGHGKTAFLFNLMMNFSSNQEYKGIVAFPRMDQKDLALYFISWVLGLNAFKHELTEEILEEIHFQYQTLTTERVRVLHKVLSLEEIFTLAEIENADYIILDDYFRSYTWQSDIERYASDYSKIQEFVNKKNIPVFVSILTSRLTEKRGGDLRPRLFDIYRSDSVCAYSHKVFQIYRPEQYGFTIDEDGFTTRGFVELMLQQNSKGKTGNIRFFHLAPCKMVEDWNGAIRSKFDLGAGNSALFNELLR